MARKVEVWRREGTGKLDAIDGRVSKEGKKEQEERGETEKERSCSWVEFQEK